MFSRPRTKHGAALVDACIDDLGVIVLYHCQEEQCIRDYFHACTCFWEHVLVSKLFKMSKSAFFCSSQDSSLQTCPKSQMIILTPTIML